MSNGLLNNDEEQTNRLLANKAKAPVQAPSAQLDTEEAQYANLINAQVEREREVLRQSLMQSVNKNPDQVAQIEKLSQQTGVPQAVVERNLAKIVAEKRTQDLEATARLSPILSQQLSDPTFASVAYDDTQQLSGLEFVLTKGRDYAGSLAKGVVGQGAGSVLSGFGEQYGVATRQLEGLLDKVLPNSAMSFLRQPVVPWYLSPEQILKRPGQELKEFGKVLGAPEGRRGFDTDVVEGIGQLGFQIAAFLTTGGATSTALLTAQGADVMADKTRKDDATQAQKDAAIIAGSGITAITERYGLDRILNRVPPEVRNRTLRFIADKAAAFGIEFAQEVTEGLLHDLARRVTTNENAPILEGALYEGSVAGVAAAIVRTALGVRGFKQASDQEQFFRALGDNSANSKLRERLPEKFQDLMRRMTEAGPVQNIYIPADRFRTFYQDMGIDPAAKAAELGARNYDEAAAAGTDIVIPIDDFTTKVAPSDDLQGLMQDLRLTQGDMTAREYAEYKAEEEARMAEILQRAKEITGEVQTPEFDQIKKSMMDNLVATGYEQTTADAYATVYAKTISNLAERSGMSATALHEKYDLSVTRPLPDVLTRNTRSDINIDPLLDRLRAGDVPGQQQIYGKSLTDFLIEKGGVSPVPELQDFDTSRERGSRRLLRPGGLSIDEAAMLAAEAGYLGGKDAADLTESDLFDALLGELGGQPAVSFQEMDEGAGELATQLANLDQYLQSIGVDLTQITDNAEVRRLIDEASQDPEIRDAFDMLFQGGVAEETEQDQINSLTQMRVSPRLPTAVASTEDTMAEQRLQPDLANAMRDPKQFEKNINLMSKYPNFVGLEGTPEQKAEAMVQQMVDNLMFLYNGWRPEFRERSKLWYVGGNRIVTRWAQRFGITPQQVAGVIAATSPQKDWFQNVSVAERILEAVINNSTTPWSPEMTQVVMDRDWGQKLSNELKFVPAEQLARFEGRTLREMFDPNNAEMSLLDMAVWIRAWDEANNLQNARVITPEGAFSADLDVTMDGKPIGMRAQSFAAMTKTLKILTVTDAAQISQVIGANHKVRSFYNNIIAPYSGDDVTIDTHAVAAALLRPLGSSDIEVGHNFGSYAANSSITGMYGTYGIYAEAYRRAAAQVGILPREMQSITWEAVRGLFRPQQKTKTNKQIVDNLWENVSKGQTEVGDARAEINELVGGIQDPAWSRYPVGSNEATRDSSYASELPGAGVPGRAAEGDAGLRAGAAAAGAAETRLFQSVSQPAFYSALSRAIEGAKQESAPATDWLAIIKKLPGVKAEEISWTGIEEYLQLAGKGKIQKQDLLDYLSANGVQLEEVMLRDPYDARTEEFLAEDSLYNQISNELFGDEFDNLEAIDRERVERRVEERLSEAGVKFDDLVLPGGQNYKELLLTLPGEAKFQSTHWDQLNVLAHVRFNERTDIDGKRVLFIEELQSDWAQSGREYGFRTKEMLDRNDPAWVAARQRATELLNEFNANNANPARQDEIRPLLDQALATEREFTDRANAEFKRGQVPTAPFVKDTKSWVALTVKRMMSYAAENGFDKIAFINGEQSADRYNLSKQVDELSYSPGRNKLFGLKDGRLVVDEDGVTKERLPEYVGKEVADRLLSAPIKENLSGIETQRISGLDLQVGGEGMVKFYDQIVPQVVNEQLKKIGGGRLESVEMQGVDDGPISGYRAMRIAGIPLEERDQYWEGLTQEERDALIDNARNLALSQPGFTITPEMRETIMAGLPLFQGEGMADKRGFIQFGPERKFKIALLEKADLSTFLHESGHFYLEVLGDLAAMPESNDQIKKDFAAVLKFLDLESRDQLSLDGKRPGSAEYRRAVDAHEKFARANEAYLMEGKAPSQELRSIFQRFRSWLKLIYREMTRLNVELDDNIRRVFDRIYATDEEIEAAKAEMSFDPLFLDAAAAGMTQAEFEAYQQSVAQATESGKEALQQKLMKEMMRERAAWWKAELAKVREEVTAEVDATPVYMAFKELTDGEIKLNKDELIDRYGSDYVKRLPRGFQRVYTTGEGMPLDAAARILNFPSGDALMEALVGMRPRNDYIRAEADRVMQERHGDLMTDGSIADEAKIALHNTQREKVLAAELRALRRKQREVRPFLEVERQRQAGERRAARAATETPPVSAFRAAAKGMIGQTAIRDLEPQRYLNAQRREGKRAMKAMADGDYTTAADAKQREMLNHFLYLEAREARDKADKIAAYIRKFERKETRERIGKAGKEYLEQIDAILDSYEFKRLPNKRIDRRASLNSFVAKQEEAGEPVNIPVSILEDGRQINYRLLSVDELNAVNEAVRNIANLASLKNKLTLIAEKRQLDEVAGDAIEHVLANSGGGKAKKIETALPGEQLGRWAKGFMLIHKKFATFFRQMDGWQDGGMMWNLFVRPLNDRADYEAVQRAEATTKLRELFRPYRDANMFKKTFVPALGQGMTLQGRLMVALNWGREENRQRLMGGNGFTQAQIDGIFATLDERDWQFVQGVWDYIDSYWPQISEQYERLYGVAPEKSDAAPFETKYGPMRGGYFPIKYDPIKSTQTQAQTVEEVTRLMKSGAYVRSQTKNGFTKEVLENLDRAVKLDFSTIYEHVNEVIHDLAMREYLLDTNKLLNHRVNGTTLKDTINDVYGDQAYREIINTIRDVAAGDIGAQNSFDQALGHIRAGVSIIGMGWNLMTGMMQPLGLTQSFVRVGPKWVAKGLMKWGSDAVQLQNSAKVIYEKSPFMRTRQLTQNREINEIRNQLKRQGKFPVVREAWGVVEDSYFQLIIQGQKLVDIPTWLGAYEKALAFGADENRAVALADQAVIDAQGGGQIKDLAMIQRGSQLMKIWTNFYSYFNTTFNLTLESFGKTNFKNPIDIGRLGVDLLMLYTVPAILGFALREGVNLAVGGEEPDEEELIDGLIREQLSYMMGTMVGLREFATVFDPRFSYSGPAGVRFIAEVERLGTQVSQGELDDAMRKAALNVSGMLLHFPAGQVNRIIDGIYALEEGEGTPAAVVFGAPK
jgi:hypothetical protein